MGDCFFPYTTPLPLRTRMTLGKKAYCINMQLICEWDCGSWGQISNFYINVNLGRLTSDRIAKTTLCTRKSDLAGNMNSAVNSNNSSGHAYNNRSDVQ